MVMRVVKKLLSSLSSYSTISGSSVTYDRALRVRRDHFFPSTVHYYKEPVYIVSGKGQHLWDHNNKKYLDLIAGVSTVSVGHSHPRLIEAIQKQASLVMHTTNIYMHEPITVYTEKLLSHFPKELDRVIFVNSGSEANDLAMLLARIYTGKWEIVGLRNSYHGASPYCVGATAFCFYKPPTATGFGVLQITNPDPFKGIWGGSQCRDSPVQVTNRHCACESGDNCDAGLRYVKQLGELYDSSCANHGPAAFMAEPIQGYGGTVQYPRNFLPGAYSLTRLKKGLCISDEVQTGFGRLGSHFWGFSSQGVRPDIVTMAKGIGSGFPLAGVVTTSAIAESFRHMHFNTFGGSPLACAVGSAVLDIIKEEKLQDNCQYIGTKFLRGLGELQKRYSNMIGDVRGKGLMIGVEMVEPEPNFDNCPVPMVKERMDKLFEDLRDQGVLIGRGGHHANVFRIKPPFVLTEEDVDFTLEVFDAVLRRHAP